MQELRKQKRINEEVLVSDGYSALETVKGVSRVKLKNQSTQDNLTVQDLPVQNG